MSMKPKQTVLLERLRFELAKNAAMKLGKLGDLALAISPILRVAVRARHVGFWAFSLICLAYAVRRQSIAAIGVSEHAMPVAKFWRVATARYQTGLGNISFLTPVYLTQKSRHFTALYHGNRFSQSPSGCVVLYLANALKEQGFFEDAEYLYNRLVKNPAVRSLALAGLGDLFLLQANWAHAFAEYEKEGVAIKPLSSEERRTGTCRWFPQRRYSEAVAVLREAVSVDAGNWDAWWLLGCAYLESEMWAEALACTRRYIAQVSPTGEDLFEEARALHGIEPAHGAAVAAKAALRSAQAPCQVDDVEVVTAAELSKIDGVDLRETGPAVTLPIKSQVIRNGEVLDFENILRFDVQYVAQFREAEILPLYGMIVVNGKYLVSDSLHHKRCDWRSFTPSIKALAANRALLCRSNTHQSREPGGIFIGYNRNYYHWLIDELPRLLSLEKCPDLADGPLLLDARADSWQIDALARIGVSTARFRMVDFSRATSFSQLVACSRLSTRMVAHPAAVRVMRQRLAPHSAGMTPRPGKRLYLTRKLARDRKSTFLNERSVMEKFKRAGFHFVDPGTLTIDQQIELFSDAEVIAGPGGAGMTNALFAPPRAKILELSSASMLCETFGSIAAVVGQEHYWCAGTSFARSYPIWIWTTFDYEIPEHDIDVCFERVL